MIIVDSSVWVDYFKGRKSEATDQLDILLAARQVVLAPVVKAELLSFQKIDKDLAQALEEIPEVPLSKDYWSKVGYLRRQMRQHGYESSISDAMIAQNCLDMDCRLLTLDQDFKSFNKITKLKLL